MKSKLAKMQLVFGTQEEKKSEKCRDTLTDSGGKGSTCDSHLTGNDQYIIKNHVENTGTDHKPKPKTGFSSRHKVGLK